MAPLNCAFKTMPTPDASQYTRFRRYTALTNDFLSTGGLRPLGGLSTYNIVPHPSNFGYMFLPSAMKKRLPIKLTQGAITLNNPITNPIPPTDGYHLFTFTPTENGWYRIIVDQFGGGNGPQYNDMDLVVGYGNTELDIPAVLDYDLNAMGYDTPPVTPVKVFSFSGDEGDYSTSYFSAGCTYQILVIAYNGDNGGTYTLTVRDNQLSLGSGSKVISTFYYTGSYQLYQFTPNITSSYDFSLEFISQGLGSNRSDIFVSTADTTLDIQGCIDYVNEEGPLPGSVLEYSIAEGGKDVFPSLENGSVYQVLVYQYNTNYLFATYELTVTRN
jgi:hypothetical protein